MDEVAGKPVQLDDDSETNDDLDRVPALLACVCSMVCLLLLRLRLFSEHEEDKRPLEPGVAGGVGGHWFGKEPVLEEK